MKKLKVNQENSLSSVYSTVFANMYFKIAFCIIIFAASFLWASELWLTVCTLMRFKMIRLGKSLETSRKFTLVWFFTSVYTIMHSQSTRLVKLFETSSKFALAWLFTRVCSKMYFQTVFSIKLFIASFF